MIGQNIQIRLEGIVFTAFQIHCVKKGYQNSAEAVRGMIRELSEYKELEGNNNKFDQQNRQSEDTQNADFKQPSSADG